MMTLRHIEVFYAVYQAGSVSGAARVLHVSQPSVSKVLRHAESRIGFTLFRLVKGRLVPTEDAHILFNEARELHARVHSLNETTRNLRRGDEGHLRIAILPSLGLDVAPAAVAAFLAKHPRVTFDIKTLHNKDMLESLYERNSDLAVVFDAPRHSRLDNLKVGSGELVLLYRKQELPDAPPRLSPDMMGSRQLIRLTDEGAIGNLFSAQTDFEEMDAPIVSVQTYYVAAALVRRGVGFAIVDEFTARANLSADLDFRPLAEKIEFDIYCIHLEDRPLSRLSKEFVKSLNAALVTIRS